MSMLWNSYWQTARNWVPRTSSGRQSTRAVSDSISIAPETSMSRIPHLAPSTSRVLSALARWAVAAACLSGSVLCPKSRIPTFTDYRVDTYEGAVKQPDFGRLEQYSGIDLRCFGGDPAAYSALRVNFAGHFVLAACSCGSGCHYLFLWDAESGKVYRDFPFGSINVWPYGSAARLAQAEYAGEQYQADSNLLVLDGCFEGTCDCAKRYYVWNEMRFRPIFRQQDRLPPGCKR
jgi:hypothetical protein